jgi:hypothetical protein
MGVIRVIARICTSKTLFITVTINAMIIANKKTSRRTIEVLMLMLNGSIPDFNFSPLSATSVSSLIWNIIIIESF